MIDPQRAEFAGFDTGRGRAGEERAEAASEARRDTHDADGAGTSAVPPGANGFSIRTLP